MANESFGVRPQQAFIPTAPFYQYPLYQNQFVESASMPSGTQPSSSVDSYLSGPEAVMRMKSYMIQRQQQQQQQQLSHLPSHQNHHLHPNYHQQQQQRYIAKRSNSFSSSTTDLDYLNSAALGVYHYTPPNFDAFSYSSFSTHSSSAPTSSIPMARRSSSTSTIIAPKSSSTKTTTSNTAPPKPTITIVPSNPNASTQSISENPEPKPDRRDSNVTFITTANISSNPDVPRLVEFDVSGTQHRQRGRATPEQCALLCQYFDRNPLPNLEEREDIARATGMTLRKVQIWFQNRRAKVKVWRKKELGLDKPVSSDPEIAALERINPKTGKRRRTRFTEFMTMSIPAPITASQEEQSQESELHSQPQQPQQHRKQSTTLTAVMTTRPFTEIPNPSTKPLLPPPTTQAIYYNPYPHPHHQQQQHLLPAELPSPVPSPSPLLRYPVWPEKVSQTQYYVSQSSFPEALIEFEAGARGTEDDGADGEGKYWSYDVRDV